jgi:hypothetical protein
MTTGGPTTNTGTGATITGGFYDDFRLSVISLVPVPSAIGNKTFGSGEEGMMQANNRIIFISSSCGWIYHLGTWWFFLGFNNFSVRRLFRWAAR